MTDKGRILIVDDNRDFVEAVKFRLEKYGYKITTAYDGEAAITRAKEVNPDIVLLDIKIPGIDGLQVLKAIIGDNPDLYVVMVTGNATLTSAIEALRYGAHDYLMKPLGEGQLERVVNRCLEKVRLARDLKDTEERLLRHSQKLAAIGQLAASIAHEVRNPLTAIRGNAQLLLREGGLGEEEIKKLKIIEEETSRCQEILNRLLGFSRLSPPEDVSIDINNILEDILSLLAPQIILGKIKVIKEFDKNIPLIIGTADQLKQAFLNFIMNALQAMPGGGSLTIATRVERNFIEIFFSDTGCGIPKENLEHLFSPFFTTKMKGEGTGLGLAISYGIIHKHHGTIEVQSKLGEGTTVTVKLPVSPSKVVREG